MRGIWSVAFALGAGACGFSAHARGGDAGIGAGDGSGIDAAPLPDVPEGETCFGTLAYDRVCYATSQVPVGTQVYTGTKSIDTDDSATCTGNVHATSALPGTPCIIASGTIAFMNTTVTISGSRPVLFLATGVAGITIDSNSVIDASSLGAHVGPGVLASCEGTTSATAKGGGFGGSFTSVGGNGGLGAGDPAQAKGLPATALAAPTQLQGGCPGGIGAGNNFTTPANGGGAIAFITSAMTLDGLVATGGDGGLASTADNAGGNGGGAGGMIVVDATAIAGNGELDAQGGGGGQGRGGNQPDNGVAGYNPSNRFIETLGGASFSSTGGTGGEGGPRVVNIAIVDSGGDARDGTSGAGGGGGGGAAGVIIATSALPIGVTTEPSPQ